MFFNVIDEKLAKEELSKRLDNSKLSKKELDNLEKEFNTLDKYRYFKKNEYDEPNYFNFQIESETRTSPEFLFFKAIVILKNRIENLISNIIDGNIKIEKVDKSKNLYSFEINNEKHTLGNLIQSLFYNEFIRNNKGKIIEFIGYNCPHPLEELLIIKIKFNEIIKEEEINNIFIEGLVKIQTEIENINNSWIKTSNLNTKLIEVDDFLNES